MKGLSPLLTHSALLLIGLIAISMIIVSASSSFSRTERNLIETEINYIAESARNEIIEIYNMVNQTMDYSNGTFQLNLPEKIGDKKYTLRLEQNNIFVSLSLQNEIVEANRTLNIDAVLDGESYLPASIIIEKIGGTITMDLVD